MVSPFLQSKTSVTRRVSLPDAPFIIAMTPLRSCGRWRLVLTVNQSQGSVSAGAGPDASVTFDIYGRPCLFIHFTSLLRAETLLTPVPWFLVSGRGGGGGGVVHTFHSASWELAFLRWFGLD